MTHTLPLAETIRTGLEAECEPVCTSPAQLQASMLCAALVVIVGLLDEDLMVKARAIGIVRRWEREGRSLSHGAG